MTYKQALKSKSIPDTFGRPYLATVIESLAKVHAINAEMTYNGAVKQGLTGKQVSELSPAALGDLMFA